MFETPRSSLLLSSALAITLISIVFLWRRKRNYVKVGTVKSLWIYPIKSLPGIQVDHIELTKSGPKYGNIYDRSYMLVTKSNAMITIRNQRKLALLKTEMRGDEVWVTDPSGLQLKLDPKEILKSEKVIESNIWGEYVKGIDCGEEASAFFSAFLGLEGVRLIHHTDPNVLKQIVHVVGGKKVVPFKGNRVRYQDETTVHLLGDKSVKDLSTRVSDAQIDHRRFKPTILVDSEPYDEDTWMHIKISATELRFLMYCKRCAATLVDRDTGERQEEPLRTLKMYRKAACKEAYGVSPILGIDCGVDVEGTVHQGDTIYAHRVVTDHISTTTKQL